MLPFDLGVCVPGDGIALGFGNAIVEYFALDLLVDAESRRLSRLRVFVVLNNGSPGHGYCKEVAKVAALQIIL